MSRLTPGTRLWVTEAGVRHGTPATPRTVESVGRKWAILSGHREGRVTAEPDDRGHYYVDRGAYTPALARTDAQQVAAVQHAAMRPALDKVEKAIRTADPAALVQVCALLGVDVGPLPTAEEILTKHGADQ